MMSRILRRSIQSARDYEQIYQYIAKDDPNAAANLLRLFDEKLALLLEHPSLGEGRPKVGSRCGRWSCIDTTCSSIESVPTQSN